MFNSGKLTNRLRKELDSFYTEHRKMPDRLILTEAELDALKDEWNKVYTDLTDPPRGKAVYTFECIPIEVRG